MKEEGTIVEREIVGRKEERTLWREGDPGEGSYWERKSRVQ